METPTPRKSAHRLLRQARQRKQRTGRTYRDNSTSRSDNSKSSWTGSKKNQDGSLELRRQRVEPKHPTLSISRQCELLGLSRSSFYYTPQGESEFNLLLMRLIDLEYTAHPFFGYRKMARTLREAGPCGQQKAGAAFDAAYGPCRAMVPGPNTSRPASAEPGLSLPSARG